MTIQNQDAIASVDTHSTALADSTKVHAALKASESQQVIRGTWWTPTATADGYIAIQNPSLTAKQVDVELSDHSAALLTQTTETVPVHGTVVYKLSELLGYSPNPNDSGDITIRYSGVAHGVVAAAGMEDPTTGFSSTPHLTEQHQDLTKPAHSVTIQAPGLMVDEPDPSMLFPVGLRFVPFTVLHNVSTHPVVATISMTSETPNGTPATRTLGTVSLAAGQSDSADYGKFPGLGQPEPILPVAPNFAGPLPRPETSAATPIEPNRTPFGPGSDQSIPGSMRGGFANISIAYQGLEGDLMADVGSMDQSGNYVFEVAPVAAGPSIGKILCFWELRGNRDTVISVWNYISAAQDFQLVLLYWCGQYRIPIHLEANKTYNLDMMTLIHSRVPDPDGVLIPSNITTGSAMLTGKGGEADTINVATSGATFSPLEQDCNTICSDCDSYSEITLGPVSPVLPVLASQQLSASGTLVTGTAFTPSGSWTSANTAMATVTTAGLLTAVAPGSTTLNFAAQVPAIGEACGDAQCPWVTVDEPDPINVPPTLTESTALWFFGSGAAPPSTFTIGSTQSVITATGANGGTFKWTIANGTYAASFAPGSQQSSTTTSGNTVTVYSIGESESSNDVRQKHTWLIKPELGGGER